MNELSEIKINFETVRPTSLDQPEGKGEERQVGFIKRGQMHW